MTVLEGICNKVLPQTQVRYVEGCGVLGACREGLRQAAEAARKSDLVITVVGDSTRTVMEAADRADLNLPGMQLELVKALDETKVLVLS